MPDDPSPARAHGLAAGLFLAIAGLIGVDLVADYGGGTDAAHLAFEGGATLLAAAGGAWMLARMVRLGARATRLGRELSTTRQEAARWQREARELLEGLGRAIDRQFEMWKLTPAEREVALLLLKGLSHKEIASVREVSERTVRHQARAVYRKADLQGRAELSAFFLEDLLLPSSSPDTGTGLGNEAGSVPP